MADQNIPDPGQHKRGQGIEDHGLVIDRQQLLAGHKGEGIKPRPGSPGEDDTFHDGAPYL